MRAPGDDAAGGDQTFGVAGKDYRCYAAKVHYLNPMPLHEIYERWIGKYERHRLQALAIGKAEPPHGGPPWRTNQNQKTKNKVYPMKKDQFVYVTHIRTTPEKLWKALIEPEFTRQFWANTAQESEWKPGASRIKAPGEFGRAFLRSNLLDASC